jgi:hypothetical protein
MQIRWREERHDLGLRALCVVTCRWRERQEAHAEQPQEEEDEGAKLHPPGFAAIVTTPTAPHSMSTRTASRTRFWERSRSPAGTTAALSSPPSAIGVGAG